MADKTKCFVCGEYHEETNACENRNFITTNDVRIMNTPNDDFEAGYSLGYDMGYAYGHKVGYEQAKSELTQAVGKWVEMGDSGKFPASFKVIEGEAKSIDPKENITFGSLPTLCGMDHCPDTGDPWENKS